MNLFENNGDQAIIIDDDSSRVRNPSASVDSAPGAGIDSRGFATTEGYTSTNPYKSSLSDVGKDDLDDHITLNFTRHRMGLSVPEYLDITGEEAARIVALAENHQNGFLVNPNDSLGNRFMRGNNSVYRDFDPNRIVTSDRYRLADPFNKKWNGPLRVMGLLRQVFVEVPIGYVVSMSDLTVVPNPERKLSLPTGSAGNMLNRTHWHHQHLVEVGLITQTRSVDLDFSVTTMVEAEGKFARNVVSESSFTHDVLRFHERVIQRHGSFLGNNIDQHRIMLSQAIRAYCCKAAPHYIDASDRVNNLLPIIEGTFNHASYGQLFSWLNSFALPDPIKVGNEGDANGNMGSGGEAGLDEATANQNLLAMLGSGNFGGLLDKVKDWLDIQNKPKSDLQAAPPQPGRGWNQPPKADGGKVWNVFHTQASNWLDGEIITPPGLQFNKNLRACWFDSTSIGQIRSASSGHGNLILPFNLKSQDYVFIPRGEMEYGNEDLIRQDGVEINVLLDRYDPVLDNI